MLGLNLSGEFVCFCKGGGAVKQGWSLSCPGAYEDGPWEVRRMKIKLFTRRCEELARQVNNITDEWWAAPLNKS